MERKWKREAKQALSPLTTNPYPIATVRLAPGYRPKASSLLKPQCYNLYNLYKLI